MDTYGFYSSIFILWLCAFLFYGLHIPDALYGVYFSVGYVFIEFLLLIRQYYKNKNS